MNNIQNRRLYGFPISLTNGKTLAEEYVDFLQKVNKEILWHKEINKKIETGTYTKEDALDMFLNKPDYVHFSGASVAARTYRGRKTGINEVRIKPFPIPKNMKLAQVRLDLMMDYFVRKIRIVSKDTPSSAHAINSQIDNVQNSMLQVENQGNQHLLEIIVDSNEMRALVGSTYPSIILFFISKHIIKELKRKVVKSGNNKEIRIGKARYEYISPIAPTVRIVPAFQYKDILSRDGITLMNTRRRWDDEEDARLCKYYESSLRLLKVVDNEGIEVYANQAECNFSTDIYQFLKTEYIIRTKNAYSRNEKFKCTFDDNHRIYSILSNTPREMKQYLNKKYEIDISNCHPLLFCTILNELLGYYSDSSESNKYNLYGTRICKGFSSIMDVPFSLSAIFGDNVNSIKQFKKEVQDYYMLTSSGKFWENTLKQYNLPDSDRKNIKRVYFASVFYGKFTAIKRKHFISEDERCLYQCATDFKSKFPNIWKVLMYIRKSQKEYKDRTILANYLMQVESAIIMPTLLTLYDEGYKVLNIHDSIFVLDVPQNDNLTPTHIQDVLTKQLENFGLKGSFKIE